MRKFHHSLSAKLLAFTTTMAVLHRLLFLATTSLHLISSSVYAVQPVTAASSYIKSHRCASTLTTDDNKLFGVVHRMPALQVRGGEVHEPEGLDGVDALILKAGSDGKLVVIDFSATWCGPCKMIAPLFKELSQKFQDVVFIKVDVDENPETAAKYNVSAMPTFVFIKGGDVADRLMGADPNRLQELIAELK